jgi:hypothetical protein
MAKYYDVGMFDRLPFIAHRIETVHGVQKQSEVAGRFVRQAAAEAFIQNSIFTFETRGSSAGALWGANRDATGARFWIETDQEASAEFD